MSSSEAEAGDRAEAEVGDRDEADIRDGHGAAKEVEEFRRAVEEEKQRYLRLLADFDFDAWGGKYPPWDADDAVPLAFERLLGLPRLEAGIVLEGGSVDGNGAGCVLTTEQCLLHENREAGRTREGMERRLADWLGARRVLWLAGGIEGDDTDGHVDDVARFVDAGTVVAVNRQSCARL